MAEINTKSDLLEKLRDYTRCPDDENIRYKEKIKNALLHCPELLYSIHEAEFESELFCEDGSINHDGEWDRYFGENSNIRPYLYIPSNQDQIHNFVTYQVSFNEIPRYNTIEKYTLITFNVFVHGKDGIDELTGIPRHDLISSILREKFNWSSIFGMKTKLISSKESLTDNNYISRVLVFEMLDLNGIVNTPFREETSVINNIF